MSVICEAYSYNKPGPPEKVLELNRHHRVSDKAGPNEVVVQVEAAALNPVDCESKSTSMISFLDNSSRF